MSHGTEPGRIILDGPGTEKGARNPFFPFQNRFIQTF